MAKARLSPMIAGISGAMGNVVFRRSKNGEVIIARRPKKSNTKPSEAQKAQRERFAQAIAYASAALADPNLRLHYEAQAAILKKTPHNLAVSDYFNNVILTDNAILSPLTGSG